MTTKSLRELRDAAPFRPFEINLSNGRSLRVVTPDHLFFIPNSPEVVVALPDGAVHIVDPDQIASVSRGTGRAKGRK